MSDSPYVPRGVRRCERCRGKILHALVRGESLEYDLGSVVYWLSEVPPGGLYAERIELSLVAGPNGLGPAVPHVRTCPDRRIPALDRAAAARVVPASRVGPREQLCRCGARFIFAESRAGAKIPLDVESRVDWVREVELDGMQVLVAEPMPFDLAGGRSGLGAAISHFRSCPNAVEFSRGQPYTGAARAKGATR